MCHNFRIRLSREPFQAIDVGRAVLHPEQQAGGLHGCLVIHKLPGGRHDMAQLPTEKGPGAVDARLHGGDAQAQELRGLGVR